MDNEAKKNEGSEEDASTRRQCGAGSFGSVLVLVASASDGVVVRGRVLGGVRGFRLGAVVVVVWWCGGVSSVGSGGFGSVQWWW